jgi:hypothetical protein
MGRDRHERGSVLLMVVLALGIFLLGAIGLGIDGSRLYAERQMAQAAADAAAQAAIMSIFNGTNTTGGAAFDATPGSSWTCTTGADPKTPCAYAQRNGFRNIKSGSTCNPGLRCLIGSGNRSGDCVCLDFPDSSVVPGVNLSGSDPTNLARATVTRRVDTTLLRLLGSNFTDVTAIGIAAIVDVVAPVPILVTHPENPGSFSMNGNPTVTICGGPSRSIQVNSRSGTSLVSKGGTKVDLSKAGPNDDINNPCTTGTGADFGDWGGPSESPFGALLLGSTGDYIQPAGRIRDPLYQVSAPSTAGLPVNPLKTPLANGVSGCPASPKKPCQLYGYGVYTNGIDVKNETAVFAPGIYYMQGGNGFQSSANGHMVMCTTCSSDPDTGRGMLVYKKGGGPFNVGANGDVNLLGSLDTSIYKGILFFQDRSAATTQHRLGGGGELRLTGTIYLTNTLSDGESPASPYQHLLLQGTPGSTTLIIGMIIVSELELGGNAGITMQLDPDAHLHVRQVALVK